MAYEAKPNTGSLFKNDKKNDKQPDYTGTWKDTMGREWQLAAWVKEGKKGKFFSLMASEKQTKKVEQPITQDTSDTLPF